MLSENHRGLRLLPIVFLAGLVAACAANSPGTRVVVEANDQMKFSVEAFEVAAGETVELTLENAGRLPKEAMGHNLVILKTGADARKFVLAATSHAADDYMDPALADEVIASTKLLGPHESDTVTFAAPSVPGDYEYVCTFPGHYALGMKGVMKVR